MNDGFEQISIRCDRPQLSPGRTPSPMEYSLYNPALIQSQLSPQYQPTSSHIVQQSSTATHAAGTAQFPYVHNALQVQLQEQLVSNRMTSNYQDGLHLLNNAGSI